MARPNFTPRALALAVALAAGGAHAAANDDKLLAELKRLAERVDKLEKRNAELEARVAAKPAAPAAVAPADAALSARVAALEKSNQEMAAALESERISENEPEFITRLKAIESQTLSYQAQARKIESFEGITAEGNVVAVAQGVNGGARSDGKSQTQLNWRGDVSVTLPGGDYGNASGAFFAHVRVGQGESFSGLNPLFTGALNSTAFQLADTNASNSTLLLAQAWYQLDIPLPLGGFKDRSKEHIEITAGKIDPFVFFDGNTIADNENEKFLNNVFVHNPMLDSGGAMGVDEYGFTPGVRLAYHSDAGKPEWWRASIGVFGSGNGASFNSSFTQPMLIGQIEFGQKYFGLDGNYRLYAWHNPQYEAYDGSEGKNTGWGVSVDQRVDDDLTLFARYGHTMSGKVAFDRAATVGAELAGNDWGRAADSVGLAYAWLRASKGFERSTPLDVDGDGVPDYAYAANGAESIAELYYRWRFNGHLSLTPDLQYIRHGAANPDADDVTAIGVRGLYAF
jgi:high affinity Mn2+ porin